MRFLIIVSPSQNSESGYVYCLSQPQDGEWWMFVGANKFIIAAEDIEVLVSL